MRELKIHTLLLLTAVLAFAAWAQEETPPVATAADAETTAVDEADGSAEIEGGDVTEAGEDVGSAEIEEAEAVEDMDDGVLDEAFEDESLDEQTYEEDEDDFIPTEEIPADEPIPFPSNI